MKIKLSRESILIILMGLMVLIGAFYYGNLYFVEPLKEEVKVLSDTVEHQKHLLDTYPPSEELFAQYKTNYDKVGAFLPNGAQDSVALVTLEELAERENVTVTSVTRNIDKQLIEGVSESFVKNNYTAQVSGASPEEFRRLIDLLMEEERVWNIPTLSYSKVNEENYVGQFTFELFYHVDTN